MEEVKILKEPVKIKGKNYGIAYQRRDNKMWIGVFVECVERSFGGIHQFKSLVNRKTGIQCGSSSWTDDLDDLFNCNEWYRKAENKPLVIEIPVKSFLYDRFGQNFEKRFHKAAEKIWKKLYRLVGEKQNIDDMISTTQNYMQALTKVEKGIPLE